MKKFLLSLILSVCISGIYAQENVTLFFLNDGTFKGFYDEEIDSISYSNFDLDSTWHHNAVVQDIWLADTVVRIPIESIDSICHKVPDPVYKPGIIKMDAKYLPYIQSVDGMIITFSSSMPESLRPHIGDVLIYEESSDLFPEGFAGRVIVEGSTVTCEEVGLQDIYDKFVLFGNYILVDKNNGSGSPSYGLQRLGSTKHVEDAGGGGGGGSWGDDDEDYGIDNWRLGYKNLENIQIGTIKKAIKIDLKTIHTTINVDYEVTPIISIELAWDLYALSKTWGIYYKRTIKSNYKNKYYVKYSRDTKPEKDSEKNLWNTFWKGYERDWIEVPDKKGDDRDDDETRSLYILNKEVPIPQFPLVKIGVKFGMFCQPKLEGELRAGWETSGTIERTYIYRLDRSNLLKRGESMEAKGPEESETSLILDGSVKGSLWLGVVAGLRLNFGFGQGNKLEGITEEASFRFGPYAEFELKADFSEALKDRSMYSLLQDSKCREGWKLGIDAKFTAKIAGVIDFTYPHASWSPKNLIGERTIYFFPKFDAPKYSVNGNSLRCWTNVNRVTFPNTIGYVLLKEDGTEAGRKYLDESYSFRNADVKYATDENPYQMVLTFDNLDFTKHRYTIVPTTRLFGWQLFGLDMPEAQQTTVLCPNSNHPHLIDMGLPSGTKWLCSNVYANAPEDAGGYYQWGKPYKSHVYNDAMYKAPVVSTKDYQGTSFDAATVNLGEAYVTPTLSQYKELLDNCTSSPRYSTWGNITGTTKGLYLKGKNGGNLYLPFSGFMKDTKIYNESKNEGFYLASDALDSENKPIRKAFDVTENLVVADAKAHGYSVRPVSAGKVGQVSFSHQEVVWDGVYVGQDSVQTVVVTNDGNSPAKITVTQTNAPFTVDAKCVGTFTIKPKERKDVLVLFKPTELENFESLLNIQYEIDNACTVCKIPLTGTGIDSKPDNHEYVDLGLPSGTLWATCNVGANSPEEYGDYFAWGEIEPKSDYSSSTYSYMRDNGYHFLFTKYCSNSYWGYNDFTDNLMELLPEDDAATANWGSDWQTPSYNQMKELVSSEFTTTERDWVNNVEYWYITSKINGNSLTLPAAGSRRYTGLYNSGDYCFYMSRSLSDDNYREYILYCGSSGSFDVTWGVGHRADGITIRPVRVPRQGHVTSITLTETLNLKQGEQKKIIATVLPEEAQNKSVIWKSNNENVATVDANGMVTAIHSGICNITCYAIDGSRVYSNCLISVYDALSLDGHEYVDLGLPSGTLWAIRNLGSESPIEFGDYFAWGETEKRNQYDESNYKWMENGQLSKYTFADGQIDKCWYRDGVFVGDGLTELLPEDDAATVNWGSRWQIPSRDQFNELWDNTTHTWINISGVWGDLYTGINGNSIFLPDEDNGNLFGGHHHWTRSLNTSDSEFALTDGWRPYLRNYELHVRPVMSNNGSGLGGSDDSSGGMVDE